MRRLAISCALAIASGLLFAWSFPNAGIGWLMFIAFVPLFIALTRARNAWEAFFFGWLQQTTAWLVMVPWVVRVMSHYGGLPYVTGVLIFIAMAAFLGLYGSLFAILFHWLRPGEHYRRWLLVPLAWCAVEYARTYLLTGFPWNLIAAAIVDYRPLIQFDRVAGPYAMSVLILLPSITIAWMVTQPAPALKRSIIGTLVVMICFVWFSTGLVAEKLIAAPSGRTGVKAALIQPNISQEMRWDDENLLLIFRRMTAMTEEAIRQGAKVIIWPESTVPLSYASTGFYRQAIEDYSRNNGVDIILGSVAEDAAQPEKLWNAAFLISGGRTIGHYDKIRLVPFGEYVPLRKMLFFARKLVHAVGDFEFGTRDMPLNGLFRYGPAICYEIVYPQIPRTQVVHGANVLVTITNDAWYDGTSAPRQHLNQARLRAIEDDRFLLRAGTTGISAFVDPSGRVLAELPMGGQGIIYADVHGRESVTPYVKLGDWFAWFAIAAVIIAIGKRNFELRIGIQN